MINKKYLKNLRCKEINSKNDFIFDLYNERIVDSLEIINFNFKKTEEHTEHVHCTDCGVCVVFRELVIFND